MKCKLFLLPVLAVALGFVTISCGNVKDKKNIIVVTQPSVLEEAKNSGVAATSRDTLLTGGIALDKLPAGVAEFIQKNYTGYAMKSAAYDPLCQGGNAIDVAITKAGFPNLSLIFKPDGSFVQQEEDLPLTRATDKIRDALKTNYAGYYAANQIEKLILADKSVQYLVDLSKGNTTKEVIFTADGKVVCESQ